jgi:hypothetical protein
MVTSLFACCLLAENLPLLQLTHLPSNPYLEKLIACTWFIRFSVCYLLSINQSKILVIFQAKQAAHARDMEALQQKAKQEKMEAARQLDEVSYYNKPEQ